MTRTPFSTRHGVLLSRVISFTSAVAIGFGLAEPASAGPKIREDFNSGLPIPRLAGYENFSLASGAIQRNGAFSDVNDRQYMRTVASDYNLQDFVYEVTFTTTAIPQTSINFIGIGSGDRRPGGSSFGHNEPWDSLFFRIHAPNADGGSVTVSNLAATNLVVLGAIPAGTHRARIEKRGNSISFLLDASYNGTFSADMSHAFSDITAVAPFLDATNSRLFFGTTFPDDRFDNMIVVPEPSSVALGAFGLAGLLGYAYRRRYYPAARRRRNRGSAA